MSPYNELPVYKAMYDLLIVVTNETLTKAICNRGFSGKASFKPR